MMINELNALHEIFNRVDVGVAVVNRDCELVLWNAFMINHSQLNTVDVMFKPLYETFDEIPENWLRQKVESVFLLQNFSFTSWKTRPYIFRFQHNRPITGDTQHMKQNCTFVPIFGETNEVTHVALVITDATETSIYESRLVDAFKRLEELTNRDGLTNAYNRRYLSERLANEFDRITRYGGVLTLILVDLDFFKKINDEHGHLAGDQALITTVERIRKTLRGADCLARYGGEEFCIICPETDVEGATILADRIRVLLADAPISFQDIEFTITASFGVATFTPNMQNVDELLDAVDKALYQSKNSGRNCVTVYQDEAASSDTAVASITPAIDTAQNSNNETNVIYITVGHQGA
ncbi:MAG: diguanylate cyclase [Gammaproteobacteria bacterium]|nr:diguanylate cyclase [Gammaproteobacteria bacterium]MDH5727563.1 diguanylate cyclase [Gammaproteobacteria bacterium]